MNILKNDLGGVLTALGLIVAINGFLLFKDGLSIYRLEIKEHHKLIVWAELVFTLAFVMMALYRSFNPEIVNTEKFMEIAFINGILKSPNFPPIDPWLSSYGISYYYFGYVLGSLFIRLAGTASELGYNLITAMWYGLTALGAYGVLYSLLAHGCKSGTDRRLPNWVYGAALLAPVMLLVVSNWHGFWDMLHGRGLFYAQDAAGTFSSQFWQDFNLRDLTVAPMNRSWFPNRGGWSWWAASRTLVDFRVDGSPIEIIDEFPAFSFLLADLHPHVLNLPFILLAVAMAVEAAFGGWAENAKINLLGFRFESCHLIVSVITLGAMAFINTWDFPFYLALIACSAIYFWYTDLNGVVEDGVFIKGKLPVLNFLLLCLIGGIASILAYLPFFLGFSSQASGFLPSFAFATDGKYFWTMFGPFMVPIIAYLIYNLMRQKDGRSIKTGLLISAAVILIGLGLTFGIGLLALSVSDRAGLLLGLIGAQNTNELFSFALQTRLKSTGTLLTVLIIVGFSLAILIARIRSVQVNISGEKMLRDPAADSSNFVLFIAILGGLIVLVPEFVYLRDQFGNRMNTIFKFYYQAWLLWSLAASFGIIRLCRHAGKLSWLPKLLYGFIALCSLLAIFFGLQRNDGIYQRFNANLGTLGTSMLDYIVIAIPLLLLGILIWYALRKKWAGVLLIIVFAALAGGLVYPLTEYWVKTAGFAAKPNLDGMRTFMQDDEVKAVEWLRNAPLGTLAEASGGEYTTYNFASAFSGQPSILGWRGHESQWGRPDSVLNERTNDLNILYQSPDWLKTQAVLDKYQVRYVMIGNLERSMEKLYEQKFIDNLKLVFESGSIRIYEN